MKETKALTSVPDGIIHVPVTPFTENNEIDLDIFGKVIEFLVSQDPGSLCVNLHLAENLNLTLEERKQLAKASVDVTSGRTPVIIHVSTPGTDQAVDLTRHAEEIGADCIMAIPPYYWKPSQEGIYEHFAAIMSASELPFIAYNSPVFMDGIGVSPETLVRLLERFPQFIGIKDASHNWEIYLELGRASKAIKPDFGLFAGTEWMIPSLTLGGNACMSVFGGIVPRFVESLYQATVQGDLKFALELQYKYSELWQIAKVDYPAPTKAMWEIMGRPVGAPRRPQSPVSKENKIYMEETLDRLGLLHSEPHGW